MAFALSIIEFVLIPCTMISAGVGLIVDYANNKSKSHKIFKSNKDPVLNNVKRINPKIIEINNNNTHEIEDKFKEALKTSEQVTKEPITFSYKPSSENESPIKAQISFVLEPDSTNGQEAEEINLSLVSSIYTIKRGIPKNHTDSSALPECRYSGTSTSIEKPKIQEGMVNEYLKNLKTLVDSANNKCNSSKTKGLTNSTK